MNHKERQGTVTDKKKLTRYEMCDPKPGKRKL